MILKRLLQNYKFPICFSQGVNMFATSLRLQIGLFKCSFLHRNNNISQLLWIKYLLKMPFIYRRQGGASQPLHEDRRDHLWAAPERGGRNPNPGPGPHPGEVGEVFGRQVRAPLHGPYLRISAGTPPTPAPAPPPPCPLWRLEPRQEHHDPTRGTNIRKPGGGTDIGLILKTWRNLILNHWTTKPLLRVVIASWLPRKIFTFSLLLLLYSGVFSNLIWIFLKSNTL